MQIENLKESMPLLKRGSSEETQAQQDQQNKENNRKDRLALPRLKMRQMLAKIGATPSSGMLTIPDPAKLHRARKVKEKQLREEYSPPKPKGRAFKGELDEIVLGCWKPNRHSTHQSVWQEYKTINQDLVFDTIRVLNGRK